MVAKRLLLAVGLASAAVFGWKFHALGGLAHLTRSEAATPTLQQEVHAGEAPPAQSEEGVRPSDTRQAGSSGIHKCKVGQSVIYTDAPCEKPGSERAMGGGAVTVVKGQQPGARSAGGDAASGAPNARDLLGRRDEPTLMQRQIERTVNE